MEGTNTIKMCQTQMIKAMEIYLKEHMFIDKDFKVNSVKQREGIHFDIILIGNEKQSSEQ